ncbi:MAG: FAD-binding oxidoreductase [Bacteroidota bacterium]
MTDTLIVGAGLAGASAALHLSKHRAVHLLETAHPAAGASGAAAGLVNPLMGRRARAVWHREAALEALHHTLALARATPLLRTGGVVRPARDAKQATRFAEAAEADPAHACWLSAEAAQARYPGVEAPHGALHVLQGGALDVSAFTEALVQAAQAQGATVELGQTLTAWGESDGHAFAEVRDPEGALRRVTARRLLLAIGWGYRAHPTLAGLALHGIKGQTIRLHRPPGLDELPILSGTGYIVPSGDLLVVGSSYEHTFADLRPSAAHAEALRAQAARMVPALADAPVAYATAGVRVTVPTTRLPLVGPVPGHSCCWVFTGLSSKGLLLGPYLAGQLHEFFQRPDTIFPEVQVR